MLFADGCCPSCFFTRTHGTIAKKKKKKKKKTDPIFTICRVRVSVRQIGKIGPLGFVVLVSMCLVRSTADKSRLQKAHTIEIEHSGYSLSEMFLLLAYLLPTAFVRTVNFPYGKIEHTETISGT